jgi:hypothetical protein
MQFHNSTPLSSIIEQVIIWSLFKHGMQHGLWDYKPVFSCCHREADGRISFRLSQIRKNAVFWDVTPCGSRTTRRLGGMSVLRRATRRNIPDDGILHSHHRENLKSYIVFQITLALVGCRDPLLARGPQSSHALQFRYQWHSLKVPVWVATPQSQSVTRSGSAGREKLCRSNR